jgi:hypothetical protein
MEAARGSKRFWGLQLYKYVGNFLYGNNNNVDITALTDLRDHLETDPAELPGIITPAERDYFRQLELAAKEVLQAAPDGQIKEKLTVLWVAYHAAPADPNDNDVLVAVLGERDTKGITYNKLHPPDSEGEAAKAREN